MWPQTGPRWAAEVQPTALPWHEAEILTLQPWDGDSGELVGQGPRSAALPSPSWARLVRGEAGRACPWGVRGGSGSARD